MAELLVKAYTEVQYTIHVWNDLIEIKIVCSMREWRSRRSRLQPACKNTSKYGKLIHTSQEIQEIFNCKGRPSCAPLLALLRKASQKITFCRLRSKKPVFDFKNCKGGPENKWEIKIETKNMVLISKVRSFSVLFCSTFNSIHGFPRPSYTTFCL